MKTILRSLALIALLAGFTGMATTPAFASPHHSSHHAKKKPAAPKWVATKAHIKTAQTHLAALGDYKGKVDGKIGRKTKAGLKKFQKEHMLPVTGKLTEATYKALEDADKPAPLPMPQQIVVIPPAEPAAPPAPPPTPKFYTDHKDYYGYVHQDYSNPMQMGAPEVPSRYGRVEVAEKMNGGMRNYDVKLDGNALFDAQNQPAVIGISKTFTLDHEDAIIFTAYRDGDLVCNYRHYLLTLGANGSKLREIANCTRGYQAYITDDVLNIVFPETDDQRAAGATWRYDHGDLVKL
jgi:hypothetical protein